MKFDEIWTQSNDIRTCFSKFHSCICDGSIYFKHILDDCGVFVLCDDCIKSDVDPHGRQLIDLFIHNICDKFNQLKLRKVKKQIKRLHDADPESKKTWSKLSDDLKWVNGIFSSGSCKKCDYGTDYGTDFKICSFCPFYDSASDWIVCDDCRKTFTIPDYYK